ncbi:uncharacterized protein LOC128214415 [Mya arenaria]|uniref:uncharacterized protein LOC128214415 n=1 Tax=Mya arenaria TaxID=6604 RepID=UPI0022E047AB|nr:uncharacterized protein LOC128214415 [Mya arenaria]
MSCHSTPTIQQCRETTACKEHEICSVEEFISANGKIYYRLGCQSKGTCQNLGMGRRSATKKTGEEDVGDITICAECCSSPFCNIEGCGQPALPTSERGPYCFTCEKASSLDGCDNVTVCEKGDNCMMFVPLLNTHIRTASVQQPAVRAISAIRSVVIYLQQCFCRQLTVLRQLQHKNHLEEATKVSFSEAQAFCRQTGDELVTLDTYAKFNSVQYAIIHHSKEQQQRNYWIGANANQTLSGKVFGWESLRTLGFTAWGPDEPDVDPSQLCVVLNVLENYEWFDTRCDSPFHFICEHDILRNGRFITGMQHPTASSKPLTTPSTPSTVSPSIHSSLTASLTTVFTTTSQLICDTSIGFTLLSNASTSLCMKIYNFSATWDVARDICHSVNADLVVLDSYEKGFLFRQWISDSQSEFWSSSQPNSDTGRQECLIIYPSNNWHDRPCRGAKL